VRYLCLGYHDPKTWNAMSEAQRTSLMNDVVAYDELLRKNGHCLDAQALQEGRTATTLRFVNGKISVTDGPFAETKEQLGGVMVLEANDLNHAIQLMSRLPCMRVGGSLEIRPINENI
jgi:hypothetical protein